MQKISSIHKFILKIQQVVGSHELNDFVHFGPHHPKVIQATFNFDEFVPACKKSAENPLFIPDIKSLLESND